MENPMDREPSAAARATAFMVMMRERSHDALGSWRFGTSDLIDLLEAHAAAVVLVEREACAKIAENELGAQRRNVTQHRLDDDGCELISKAAADAAERISSTIRIRSRANGSDRRYE